MRLPDSMTLVQTLSVVARWIRITDFLANFCAY